MIQILMVFINYKIYDGVIKGEKLKCWSKSGNKIKQLVEKFIYEEWLFFVKFVRDWIYNNVVDEEFYEKYRG